MTTNPIRIALIGAGVFAQTAHIPAILALGDTFEIVAIYSRNLENAQARAAQINYPVAMTNDLPGLLIRQDVDALDILLPIHMQALVTEMALGSNKHVISEKPIAPDMATAQALIERYTGTHVWMVAENYRYEPTFLKARELIDAGAIGRPLSVSLARHIPFMPTNKYYDSGWRRGGDFPGGLLLDGGIHHIAALRLLLGEITQVSAITALFRDDLPPADALASHLLFANGAIGTYLVNYSSGIANVTDFALHGEAGSLHIGLGEITLNNADGRQTIYASETRSVDAEFAAFAAAINHGEAHQNTPQQALQDLAVLEALLQSAERGEIVSVATFV